MSKKIAFISGATSGLGVAFACYFAKMDYDLIITGHPDDQISPEINELISKYKTHIEIIPADFSIEDDIVRTEECIKKNPIEVLINNAGFGFGKPFWKNDVRSLEGMIKVHISAPVRFIVAVLPNMILNHKGVIINLSSLASFMSNPQDAMYSATKLFNNNFMESLHITFKDQGIKVQVLCPGFIRNTHFHRRAAIHPDEMEKRRLLPWMDPEKVVSLSVKNLKRKNKVVVVPGWRNRVIKFILSVIPRPVFYQIATRFIL